MNTHKTLFPTCPHCGHAMTTDDMIDSGHDLFALAPNEGSEAVTCPSCDAEYWVKGGYRPEYTSALAEELL